MTEQHKPQQNHLLAALPVEVQSRLFPNLELIDMPYGKVLYAMQCGTSIFPSTRIVSLVLR